MNRRDLIKNLGLISGSLLLLPACQFSKEQASIAMNRLNISTKESDLVDLVINTILPEGDMPGGLSLNVQYFVWVIVDDCISTNQQTSFIKGLNQLNQESKSQIGSSFSNLDDSDKEKAILKLLENKNTNSEVQYFLNTTKQIAVWGYMNTEYFKTKAMPYQLVPGPFSYQPCKTIVANEKININA